MIKQIITGLIPGLALNLIVIAIGALALILWNYAPDNYYLAVQEDEILEWATYWSFIAAGVIYLHGATRPGLTIIQRWFSFGLALFCLVVAFEEISWGQRVFGYRPPEYFLEYNFQQELNLHNVIDTSIRKLSVLIVIIGYGVALPLLNLAPPLRKLFVRTGIRVPPAILIPAYAITGISQNLYPIKYTGEWIEMMLGLCFLFSALTPAARDSDERPGITWPIVRRSVGIGGIVLVLGIVSAALTNRQREADPANIDAAFFELETLKRDFLNGNISRRGCGLHRRVFTVAQKNRQKYLFSGEFTRLVEQGMPEQRADFFLDPWNYAYWIRMNCASGRRPTTTYIYSFGPNQRRDSTRWEILGDDIVVVLYGRLDEISSSSMEQDTED